MIIHLPQIHSHQSQWTAFVNCNASFLSRSHISVGLGLTMSFISILYPRSLIPLQTRIWPHLRPSSWHNHIDLISGLLRKVVRLIYCIFCILGNGSVSQHYQGSCCKAAIPKLNRSVLSHEEILQKIEDMEKNSGKESLAVRPFIVTVSKHSNRSLTATCFYEGHFSPTHTPTTCRAHFSTSLAAKISLARTGSSRTRNMMVGVQKGSSKWPKWFRKTCEEL